MIKTRICDMISLHNLKTYHKKLKNFDFWGTFHQIIKQTTQHTVYRRTKCHNEMRNSQIPCTFDSLIHIE
jgi:hypothetical protein